MPYKDLEKQRQAMRKIMREWRKRRREAQKFANERAIQFLKLIGEYDSLDHFYSTAYPHKYNKMKKSLDYGFLLLNDWLLPKYLEASYLIAKKRDSFKVYQQMLYPLVRAFSDLKQPGTLVRCAAYYFASGLSHIDEKFAIIARWIRHLENCVHFADSSWKKEEAESFKEATKAFAKGDKKKND